MQGLRLLAVASLICLAGCAGQQAVAPIGRAPQRKPPAPSPVVAAQHVVAHGDTLYSIAWRYGLDYQDIARWNDISEPYLIRPGQKIALRASGGARQRRTDPARRMPRPPSKARPAQRAEPRAKAGAGEEREDRALRSRVWRWPARGKVIGRYGSGGGKGIDIAGSEGDAIVAAADGRVVYSGSGLRGYGRLIIVKHDKRFLSAYAHNKKLHVKEGESVKSGQRIADMGRTDAKRVKLHFEIRRDGKPVDPIRYLPG